MLRCGYKMLCEVIPADGQTRLYQLLQAHEDAQLGVVPGETALEVDGIGGADGAVGGELDGTALDEGACRHDDIGIVAGHGPRLRCHIAVHWGGGLDAPAEGHHSLRTAQCHRLDDVVAVLGGGGHAGKAQLFIDIGGKHRALQGSGSDGGGEEQTLIEGGHEAQVGAYLLAQARGGESVGAPLHAFLGAADVAADGSKAAAGVFDEAAHHHVGSHIGGFH